MTTVTVADQLRRAREDAGLSQRALAQLAGTSQATVSLYESGRKSPTVATLARLLDVTGSTLRVVAPATGRVPGPEELATSARRLADVLQLAEALPFRAGPTLRYPRLAA